MNSALGDNASVPSERPGDNVCLIVSDLVSLLDSVRAGIELVETAIAQEASGNPEFANIVVLDDVTPLYANAAFALCACDAKLTAALQFLMLARPSRQQGRGKLPEISPIPASRPAGEMREDVNGRDKHGHDGLGFICR
ncbi:MAG: hypothetical protein ACREDL_01570 [Bradyrhizobium sp.]